MDCETIITRSRILTKPLSLPKFWVRNHQIVWPSHNLICAESGAQVSKASLCFSFYFCFTFCLFTFYFLLFTFCLLLWPSVFFFLSFFLRFFLSFFLSWFFGFLVFWLLFFASAALVSSIQRFLYNALFGRFYRFRTLPKLN